MDLSSLIFSDLFIPEDLLGEPWYKESPSSMDCRSISAECRADVDRLRDLLVSMSSQQKFRIDFEGMRLRVQRMDTSGGSVFVCRRFLVAPISLPALGFPPQIAQRLLSKDMKNGFILFTGSPGAGKTTTAMALVVEWLTIHGGVCWTVENPIEINISGQHGKGKCYQTESQDDSGFGRDIISIKRASPNLIMVGEIMDEDAARQAIIASLSGRLVVSTFHANNVVEGLEGFASMVSNRNGLASSLRAVLHLELRIDPSAPQKRILRVEPLLVTGNSADAIRSMIRSGEFYQIKSEIDRQRVLFMENGLP